MRAAGRGCFGVPPRRHKLGYMGSDLLVTRVIAGSETIGNNAKRLERDLFCNPSIFSDLIGFPSSQILVLLAPPAWPINRHPLNLLAFAHPKGNW